MSTDVRVDALKQFMDMVTFDSPDLQASAARVFDTDVTAICGINSVERERRADILDPALLKLDVLDALLTLPLGMPTSRSNLPQRTIQALHGVGSQSVARLNDSITRLVDVPLEPELVIVRAHHWENGLRRASAFSTYCRRLVHLTSRQFDLREISFQADFYGVGLAMTSACGLELIVAPQEVDSSAPTPASWWLAEELFTQSYVSQRLPSVQRRPSLQRGLRGERSHLPEL